MSFYRSIAPYYDFIFSPSPAQLSFIASRMGDVRDKHLLEAGCGTGSLLAILSPECERVDGIDLDDQMIDRAKEKYGALPNVSFRVLDMLALTPAFPAKSFDGVVSFGNTLPHLRSVDQVALFFHQAATVLKKGGHLMVQIINYDHVLDHNLKGLPTIENEAVCFERYYEVVDPLSCIDFRTVLTVKATGERIVNKVSLFPLRKKMIVELLEANGFEELSFFSSFNGAKWVADSIPLIFSARCPS